MFDYGEDFNEPDYVKVDIEEYQRDQEKIEYYKTTIDYIKDSLKDYLEKQCTIEEAIAKIGIIIKELEDEI